MSERYMGPIGPGGNDYGEKPKRGRVTDARETLPSEQECDWNEKHYKCRVHPTCEGTRKHIQAVQAENEQRREQDERRAEAMAGSAADAVVVLDLQADNERLRAEVEAASIATGPPSETWVDRCARLESEALVDREDIDRRQQRIEAALALHSKQPALTLSREQCGTCHTGWPCPTVKALKGEES